MAPNEEVCFHGKVELTLSKPSQSHFFDEKLMTRGSMYDHFPQIGLA